MCKQPPCAIEGTLSRMETGLHFRHSISILYAIRITAIRVWLLVTRAEAYVLHKAHHVTSHLASKYVSQPRIERYIAVQAGMASEYYTSFEQFLYCKGFLGFCARGLQHFSGQGTQRALLIWCRRTAEQQCRIAFIVLVVDHVQHVWWLSYMA